MNNGSISTVLNIYNDRGYDLILIIYAIAIFTLSSHEPDGHT
jgi:hypothetical protein